MDLNTVLDGVELPDSFKNQIAEAWDAEVAKNREMLRAEVQEKINEGVSSEIAKLVEAADALITSTLKTEMNEMMEQRKEIKSLMEKEYANAVKQRVNESRTFKRNSELLESLVGKVLDSELRELIKERKELKEAEQAKLDRLDTLIQEGISSEITELEQDRKQLQESVAKMENLVVGQLTRELSEFQTDRRALKEKSAKLDKEFNRKLDEHKQAFMERAEKSISKTVDSALRHQLTELKEDIQIAKNNTFGRKIFEAFAGEYLTSHLSEGTEIHRLRKQLEESSKNTAKMQEIIQEKEVLLNKSKAALHETREASKRSQKLNELMRPLNRTQRETMNQLLEGVKLEKLEDTFKKYIPTILESNSDRMATKKPLMQNKKKPVLSENSGNRSERNYKINENTDAETSQSEIADILRLSGITVNK